MNKTIRYLNPFFYFTWMLRYSPYFYEPKFSIMRLSIITLFLTVFINFLNAQDIIYKKNGEEIQAKVTEIGISEVKYQKFDNQSGPTYVISKSDLIKIRFENQKEEIFSEAKSEEVKKSKNTDNQISNSSNASSGTGSYMDRVREVQANDPGFCFYLGNGFGIGRGFSNPVVGFDIRLSKKNPFIRGIALGLRAGFQNLAYDGDQYAYDETFGYGLTVRYFAPVPIRIVQPYAIFQAGMANRLSYVGGYVASDLIIPWMGFGVGSNFMVAKRFGFFVEFGYFTTSLVDLGLTFKF
jgi:hypothetical protein